MQASNMTEEYEEPCCCEYEGALRTFLGDKLDGCDCDCHEWQVLDTSE
jgi:hypothetical protein